MVRVVRGLAIGVIELVYVQWQIFRTSDEETPLYGIRRVETRASGRMRVVGR
jgi:hypothetical protein